MTAATSAPGGQRTVGLLVGALAVGVLVTATLAVSPLLPVVVCIGLAAVALAASRPHAFVLVGLTVIILTALIERLAGGAAGNADEAVVLVSVVAFGTRRLVTEGRLVLPAFAVPVLLFLAAGVASTLLERASAGPAATAALVAAKAALYGWALAQLRWGEADIARLVRFGAVAAVVVLAAGVVNLALPGPWAVFTTGRAPAHLGPVPAVNGLFQHPAAMSRFCALLAVGAFAFAVLVRGRGARAIVVVATVLSVITLEVKSLLGLFVAYLVLGVRWMRPSWAAGLLCLAPLPVVLVGAPVAGLVQGTLDDYVFQQSARLRISTGAVELAAQHLPFGAGLGRWGSSAAAADYSPLYLEAGFENVHGLSPRAPQFLNDTQWPSILGETGWLGAAAFAAALLAAGWTLLRALPEERPLERWIRTAGLAWLIVLVVESIAAPVFVSTPSYPFLFLGAGVVASLRADRARRPARSEVAA